MKQQRKSTNKLEISSEIKTIIGLGIICIVVLCILVGIFLQPASNKTSPIVTLTTINSSILPTIKDQEIHDYVQSLWDTYGSNITDAQSFIDTAKHFNKSIIEISRSYNKVVLNQTGKMHFTDAELDTLSLEDFKDMGFKKNNGNWYYKDKIVNMGTALDKPQSFLPKSPEPGKEIDAYLYVTDVTNNNGHVEIIFNTNLPNNMEMFAFLRKNGVNEYPAKENIVAKFGTAKAVFENVDIGKYEIYASAIVDYLQLPDVQTVVGKGYRNLVGKLIKTTSYGDHELNYSEDVEIK